MLYNSTHSIIRNLSFIKSSHRKLSLNGCIVISRFVSSVSIGKLVKYPQIKPSVSFKSFQPATHKLKPYSEYTVLLNICTKYQTQLIDIFGAVLKRDSIMADQFPTSKIAVNNDVRGMKTLDKDAFTCTIQVPSLLVPHKAIKVLTKHTRDIVVLKIAKVKPVVDLDEEDPSRNTHKRLLLHPDHFSTPENLSPAASKILNDCDIDMKTWKMVDLELQYENWSHTDILKAVLPKESDGVAGFSQVGHIVHLNLREDVLDFKAIIGNLLKCFFLLSIQIFNKYLYCGDRCGNSFVNGPGQWYNNLVFFLLLILSGRSHS